MSGEDRFALDRIVSFSDAVFAIVITLLAFMVSFLRSGSGTWWARAWTTARSAT